MARRGSGLSVLFVAAVALAAWVWRALIWQWCEVLIERVVRWRLGGAYTVRVNVVDTLAPTSLPEGTKHKVAVVGSGLAGIAAASTLAERGYDVVIYEKAGFLGGRLGAWDETMPDGTVLPMEHGFHAWFPNYHNLNRWLDQRGILDDFSDVADYLVLDRARRPLSFEKLHKVPILNLIGLATQGLFDWRELVIDNPGVERLNDLLNYHPIDTFERLDDESYAHFADEAKLPERMRLIFTTFTRAFFAEASQMSMAEMVKSFHGYFLSHDGGLLFRYPTDDHARSLWAPIRAHLEDHGVAIRLNTPVERIERQKNGRLRVNGQPYDDVVLATDGPATAALLDANQAFVDAEAPGLRDRVAAVQGSARYAVVRLWTDIDLRVAVPDFVFVERVKALDSITTCHRYQTIWKDWVAEHGGAVLELHCYSLPDDLVTDEQIRDALVDDLFHYFPELVGMQVRYEAMHVQANAAALHTGMHAIRPGVATGAQGLWLAGDWVKLPLPVMLMEGAFTSGLLVANSMLDRAGLRQVPVYSVPDQGVLYGLR